MLRHLVRIRCSVMSFFILFLTITLANLNRFLYFYIILIVKKFYMRVVKFIVNLLRKTFVHKIIAYFCGYDFIFFLFLCEYDFAFLFPLPVNLTGVQLVRTKDMIPPLSGRGVS